MVTRSEFGEGQAKSIIGTSSIYIVSQLNTLNIEENWLDILFTKNKCFIFQVWKKSKINVFYLKNAKLLSASKLTRFSCSGTTVCFRTSIKSSGKSPLFSSNFLLNLGSNLNVIALDVLISCFYSSFLYN